MRNKRCVYLFDNEKNVQNFVFIHNLNNIYIQKDEDNSGSIKEKKDNDTFQCD